MTAALVVILGFVGSLLANIVWTAHRKHDFLLVFGRALQRTGSWVIEKRGTEKLNRSQESSLVTLELAAA